MPVQMEGTPMHIVLVHGAGGTASTWDRVTPILAERGHDVSVVTNPLQSLYGDIAHTRAAVDAVDGPVLLVGHSYGGAVITGVGTHDRVTGLVYIAAFAPDEGESIDSICDGFEPAESENYSSRNEQGEWITDRSDAYWNEIGWDLSAEQRSAMERETRRCEEAIFVETTATPAWKTLPSWYLLATADRNIRPAAQRFMAERAGAAITDLETSHFTPRIAPLAIVEQIELALAGVSA